MISSPVLFFIIIFTSVWLIKFVEAKATSKFFEYVPSIVIIYFVMMIIGNMKLFEHSMLDSISPIKSFLISSMIMLMLLKSDIKAIAHMKFRLLAVFLIATLSIILGFVIMWALFGRYFDPSAYKAFGALSGSWIGGTANMMAVASATGTDNELLGFCLITDSVNYSIWLMILLFIAPYKAKFNHWCRAKESIALPKVSHEKSSLRVDITTLLVALLAPMLTIYAANHLPQTSFVNSSFWSVLLSTIIGIGLSFSRLAHNNISGRLGFWFLYFIIAISACGASFENFDKAPLFVIAGSFVIVIHAIIMITYAKVFRVDLFSISVSSLANIGGVASAPVLAANYSNNLISVGVIMAMLGYILGTFGGLFVTYILSTM